MEPQIRNKCIPMVEQIKLINECRRSGLTDADRCRERSIPSSTCFIKIIRKRIKKAKETKITSTEAEKSRQQLIQGIKDADIEEQISDILSEKEEGNEDGEMC